ncbi:MAG TPA: VWA domain-containing protein [Pyrinomonadaceae bacterium]|nr:VWA domain-containing protein [Pyrinomonadaceae bacterium]
MRSSRLKAHRVLAALAISVGLTIASGYGQSSQRDKPKLKDFGSSLKRLKWDPIKKEARETYVPASRTNSDDDVIRFETTLVAQDLLVTDKQGRPVRGLTANDFVITEDGKPQQVGHFFLGDNVNRPRSIVLIIDYSRSQFPFIRESVEAAKLFVDKLGPRDQIAVVTDDVELLVEFTSNKQTVKKRLDSLVERNLGSKGFLGLRDKRAFFGRSAQFSALMATLKEAFDDEDERPIIVFQTDGDELEYLRNPIINPTVPANLPPDLRDEIQGQVEQRRKLQAASVTEFSLDDVYREIEKSRTTIYTIIPGIRLLGLSHEEQLRRLKTRDDKTFATWEEATPAKTREVLEAREEQRRMRLLPQMLEATLDEELKVQSTLFEVARTSGGWAEFLENQSQATAIYARILADLNERYIVGYYPTNKERDGRRRQVNIEVKGHPEYVVSGRKSYYAPDD